MYNYVYLTIEKWSGSTSCQDSDTIDFLVDYLQADFIITDYYFDPNDYSNPVKNTYNDKLKFYGVSGITKTAEIRMKRNDVTDQK